MDVWQHPVDPFADCHKRSVLRREVSHFIYFNRLHEFGDGMPARTIVKMSESGYISSELFLFWLQHFNSHRTQGKVILILDGHTSHVKNLEVLDFASQNDITMICLQPQTTHFIQTLDRSFFKALKVYYDQACKHSFQTMWVVLLPGYNLEIYFAWGKAATTGNATNEFRVCGIYPVDRYAIPDNAYAPSAVSDLNPAGGRSNGSSDQSSVPPVAVQPSEQQPAVVSPAVTAPTTSPVRLSEEASHSLSSTTTDCTSTSVSFRDLHPTPKITRTQKTNDGRRQKAAVLTSTSYWQKLFDLHTWKTEWEKC